MPCLHFVSLDSGNTEYSFIDLAESVLQQKNRNWQWTIEANLFQRLEDSDLKRKLTADKRIEVVDLSSGIETIDLTENWAITFLHLGFSLSNNFVDLVERHQKNSSFDLLYTDLQLISAEKKNVGIWRRPHQCFERLLHQNYVSGVLVIQKNIIERVRDQGFTALSEIENRAICDVVSENGTVRHVFEPVVSANRKCVAELMLTNSPDWLESASFAAVQKQQGFVKALGPTGNWVMRRMPKEKVSISIVIPTRGDKKRIWGIETDLIENVVKSLFDKTSTEDFEVVIVHDVNASYNEHVKSLGHYGKRVKIVPYEKPFNFSEKCNVGVLHSSAKVVVFLNDDIEIIDSWWLDHLVGYLESSEVGAVGPVLLLDNGMVQTAGHVNQPLPANYYSGKPFGVKSFPEPLDIPCEVSGLTAACLAVRREVFDEVGGFCEDLPNNFNDVDFCLKIQETGRSLIWTPLARLYHFETTTRETTVTEEETQFIKDRWGRTFGVDLYRSRID